MPKCAVLVGKGSGDYGGAEVFSDGLTCRTN